MYKCGKFCECVCVDVCVWMHEEWSIPFQCLIVLNDIVYINGIKDFVNIFFGKVSL